MNLDFDSWSHALALTESGDDPNAPLGDGGRAAGRWQQHPTFYERWAPKIAFGTEPTWDEQFAAALRAFYAQAVARDVDDVDAACGFNLHGAPVPGSAALDPEYAARFRAKAGL